MESLESELNSCKQEMIQLSKELGLKLTTSNITNSASITEANKYALDAREKNPNISDSLASQLSKKAEMSSFGNLVMNVTDSENNIVKVNQPNGLYRCAPFVSECSEAMLAKGMRAGYGFHNVMSIGAFLYLDGGGLKLINNAGLTKTLAFIEDL